jgi:hypothetical protein
MLNVLPLIPVLLVLAWAIRELIRERRKRSAQQPLPQQPERRVVRPVTPPATDDVQVVDSPSLRLEEFCRAQRRAEAEGLSPYDEAGSHRPARARRIGPAVSGEQDPRWAEYEKLCPYDKAAPHRPVRVRRSGRAASGGLPSLGKRRR